MGKKLLKKGDILITQDNACLHLECAGLVREIDLSKGVPRTTSLCYGTVPLATEGKILQDFQFMGFAEADDVTQPYVVKSIKAVWVEEDAMTSAHAEVTLECLNVMGGTRYRRVYTLFPGLPTLGVHTYTKSPVLPLPYWNSRVDLNVRRFPHFYESRQDSLELAFEPKEVTAVEFFGRTDITSDLVHEHSFQEKMMGNLLFLTREDGAGMILLHEAPPSTECRDLEAYDFRVTDSCVYACGWGVLPDEFLSDHYLKSYRNVILAYKERSQAELLLKQYLRTRFPMTEKNSGNVEVNPWGCGVYRDVFCEEQTVADILAAQKAGATAYQIDDSWQKGRALQSLTKTNERIVPREFWAVSPTRLKGTLQPMAEAAKSAGIELGLWFAPSFNCNIRDWKACADILLGYYRTYGFRLFKVDGIRNRTYECEENMRNLLEYMRRETDGKVWFNLDTTNGQRQGYFMNLEYGNIFLENRYVNNGSDRKYTPEQTLGTLWQISRYVRSQFLQIEIPNPDDVVSELYEGELNPLTYSLDYWCAISIFSSPLLWMSPSRCSDKVLEQIHKMMQLHHRIWPDIYQCEVFPIGEMPNGKAITGFQAHNVATGKGYILAFRELNASAQTGEMKLVCKAEKPHFKLVHASCDASIEGEGASLKITLKETKSFALWKY